MLTLLFTTTDQLPTAYSILWSLLISGDPSLALGR